MTHEPIPQSHAHHSPSQAHVHVVPPRVLLLTFAGLMVLTIMTVGVTRFDLGLTCNVWIALAIAVAKAALVALFFMHLRWDSPFNGIVFICALFFVALFIGWVMLDAKEYQVSYEPPSKSAPAP
jgi:cytochrome c oxidase subunit 4